MPGLHNCNNLRPSGLALFWGRTESFTLRNNPCLWKVCKFPPASVLCLPTTTFGLLARYKHEFAQPVIPTNQPVPVTTPTSICLIAFLVCLVWLELAHDGQSAFRPSHRLEECNSPWKPNFITCSANRGFPWRYKKKSIAACFLSAREKRALYTN